jgi:CBS-domain-containing membrane protein
MSKASETVTVANVMTRRVSTGSPEQSLDEVWKILVDEGCHHLPILDDGLIVGIVSTSDLVELARQNGARRLNSGYLDGKVAADIMTTKIESIQEDDSIDLAIERIGPGEFHALLVVDEMDALTGIVTHHDLLHYLAS